MIYLTMTELRTLVDMEKIDADLIGEIFVALRSGGKQEFLFTNTDEYLTACPEHARKQGWDPETTLVLYEPPPTEEERAEMAANTAKQIAEDPDWDDIQIGYVDPKQIICSFFPEVSKEKMAQVFNSYANLKAFL